MVAVLQNLMARRVPHYLGTYIAGAWITIELISWVVDRYVLSDHIIDFTVLLLLLLAPAVLIIAYHHGAPGRDQSTRFERVALAVNLGIAVLILAVAFSGTDLGAATTDVTIQDEAGNPMTVRVPKSEFRRRVGLFPLGDNTSDPEDYWIPLGLNVALTTDLAQDPFVKVSQNGPYYGEDTPFAQQLDWATRQRLEFMVSGTVSRVPEGLAATVSLHDVASGRVIHERRYSAAHVFALADTVASQLKRDIGIPAGHLRTLRDLPVSELLTPSETAFHLYIDALITDSWTEEAELLEAATAEDSTFALAHLKLYGTLRGMGRREKAIDALQSAMQHSYRMPESDRNLLLIQYFWIAEQDAEKALSVAEQWATLFPDEVTPHRWVGEMKEVNGDLEGAIAAHQQILELDSLETGSLSSIAGLEEALGHFDRALLALEEYTEREPENASAYLSKARLERRLGQHDSATESCEEARLIQPRNVDALRCLGAIQLDLGRLDGARERFEQAMEYAGSPGARAAVHMSLASYHQRLGQPSRALEERARNAAELEGTGTLPNLETALRTALLPLLVMAGRIEEAFDTLEVIRGRVEPRWSVLRWQAEIDLFSALEDRERLGEAADSLAAYESYAPLVIRPSLLKARGRLLELSGDYAGAVGQYQAALDLSPVDTEGMLDLGRSYLALGDVQRAQDQYDAYLRMYPQEPRARVGLAKVMINLGEMEEAVGHLDDALAVWAEAEPGFQPAIEARRLRAELDLSQSNLGSPLAPS